MNKHNSSISSFKENVIFILKAIAMFLIVSALCLHIMPQYLGGYQASLIDKVNLLRTVKGPKIVLIGNSNLAFGIKSEMLESAFGKPVINMGLHGGLGNAFHEEMAKINISEGDIYIIAPSGLGSSLEIGDKMLGWSTIEDHLPLWGLLNVRDIFPMYKAYPVYLKRCINLYAEGTGNQLPGGCYSRDAFNKYGDIETIRTFSNYTFEPGIVKVPEFSDNGVKRINALDEYLKKRGAVLLVAGYPIGSGEYTPEKKEYQDYQKKLEASLSCPVISDYTDYMLDYKYFYNTELHLTDAGAVVRTVQLIRDLGDYMGIDTEEKIPDYYVYLDTGFYKTESDNDENWISSQNRGDCVIYGFKERKNAVIPFHIKAATDNSSLTIHVENGGTYNYFIGKNETRIEIPLNMKTGENILHFSCDSIKPSKQDDEKVLSFSILNVSHK